MKSKDVSKKFNISIDTLRYWEKAKIIPQIERDSHGYRNYSEDDCKWIGFVKCMRNGGANIKYLQKYYQLAVSSEDTKIQRKQLLQEQLLNLQKQLNSLQQNYEFLNHKINNWDEYFG